MNSNVEADVCDADSQFGRDALVETIRRRIRHHSVDVTLTTLMTTAASLAATQSPLYVFYTVCVFSAALLCLRCHSVLLAEAIIVKKLVFLWHTAL